jgi:hypothetical protein
MRRWIVGLAVAVVLVGGGQSKAAVVQWRVEDGGNGHWYELVGDFANYPDDVWSWQDSKVLAEGRVHLGVNGHLATITSEAENQFILDNFFPVGDWWGPTWIGLTDSEEYGGTESFDYGWPDRQTKGWVWVTGEPVEYTNWYPDDITPANYRDEQDFVGIGSQWNDHSYWTSWLSGTAGHGRFIVEYDAHVIPEPCTLIIWSLLGGLGLGFGWWRRRKG